MNRLPLVLALLALAIPAAAQPDAVLAADLDGDGAADFTFAWSPPFTVGDVVGAADCATVETASELSVHPAPGRLVAADGGVALPLAPGGAVGPDLAPWSGGPVLLANRIAVAPLLPRAGCDEGHLTWHGPWGAPGAHRLGVALDTPEGRRYGWVRILLDPAEGHATLGGHGLAPAPGVPVVVEE